MRPKNQSRRFYRYASPIFVLFAAVAVSCSPPFGETLVVVNTNATVGKFVSNLRVDLYSADGTWFDSRELNASDPQAWPLSFSVYSAERGPSRVRVRLRGYPQSATRDYQGERFLTRSPLVLPHAPQTLQEMCDTAPTLPPNQELTLRRGAVPFTEFFNQDDCQFATAVGSVAVKFTIATAGQYRFEVVRTLPDGSSGNPGGDTTLWIRRDCLDRGSQIVCNDDIVAHVDLLSRIETALDPGDYTLITGGSNPQSPADITLLWAAVADFTPPIQPGTTEIGQALPRLMKNGIDATPSDEPQPNLSIDRLIDVMVQYGDRKTAGVDLDARCFGTQANLAGGESCIAQAGKLEPVAAAPLEDGINRAAVPKGTWTDEARALCQTDPRMATTLADGTPLFDDEVCIPGGAFILGDENLVGLGRLDAVPRQVVVVEPFLLDAYEMTVGRYRKALNDGFVPVDSSPRLNNGALTGRTEQTSCTFSGDADGPESGIDRERFPVSCISWYNARALCQFFGGDLPTHAEWEYAATVGSGDLKTEYPWGDDDPTCDRVVFSRADDHLCKNGVGPSAVNAKPWVDGDVTPLGVHGLGGNLREWTLDSMRPYSDSCWQQQILDGVGCFEDDAPLRSSRGGTWATSAITVRSALVDGEGPGVIQPDKGFRCARKGAGP